MIRLAAFLNMELQQFYYSDGDSLSSRPGNLAHSWTKFAFKSIRRGISASIAQQITFAPA
jgi:hypothetical protein